MTQQKFGAFVPGQDAVTDFVMYADDCLLHFTEPQWTDKQREDHEANVVLTAMLQVALLFMGRSKDYAALHDTFLEPRWQDALQRYHRAFGQLFGDVIALEHLHYHPRDGFYESVAQSRPPVELLSLYMVSGSNLALHDDPEAWALSQRVNSKMHFAATAPAAGLPVPETLVLTKAALASPAAAAFFAAHKPPIMVKIQGLAGARNVTAVSGLEAAQAFVADFDDELQVLLQERLDPAEFTEMTVDLTVSDSEIDITNVRQILFAQGLWVGNYISDRLQLTAQQRNACLAVGRYVRELGYSSPEGFNCGIDFFVPKDPTRDDLVVIEINARWTGGLFPAHLLERLGVRDQHSIAFIDVVSASSFEDYLQFVEAHLQAPTAAVAFQLLPMGFSPFPQVIDGDEKLYVWQVVTGDFEAFKVAKRQQLGDGQLPTADLISRP